MTRLSEVDELAPLPPMPTRWGIGLQKCVPQPTPVTGQSVLTAEQPTFVVEIPRQHRYCSGSRSVWSLISVASPSLMRVAILVLAHLSLSTMVMADPRTDFEQARARWESQRVNAYTFNYQDQDSDVVSPYCAGALIRVRVAAGKAVQPVVLKGTRRCPKGTRGKSIDVEVPKSIDALFDRIRRWLYDPPTPVNIEVTYDSRYGIPLSWKAVKPDISDSDEGFTVTDLQLGK